MPEELLNKIKELGYENTNAKKSVFDAKQGDVLLDNTGNTPLIFKVIKVEEKDKIIYLTIEVLSDDPENDLFKGQQKTFDLHPSDGYDDVFVLNKIDKVESNISINRLVKKSSTEKWSVGFSAEDGYYQKQFDTKELAIEYIEKQTGKDLKDKTDEELKNVIDGWGRSFELSLQEIDNCEVCDKKNVPIVMIEGIKSCYDCWDGYECGVWDVEDGKVVKEEDTFKFNWDDDEDTENKESKKISRLKKMAGNKLDEQSFKQYVLSNGKITIDSDGADSFVVTQINDQNFRDISPLFKKQLEDEGKYNSWINFITFEKQPPYTVKMLPIYGSSERYVTKWFTNTAEEAIDQALRDRQTHLLKRANDYIQNNL